jgi:ATPase subunit of ABC transporter with duplicated ATPase domains
MLEISDLTYRIAGRTLFDGASAFIADGWKVGLVGRNGSGKSTLLKLIREESAGGAGSIRIGRNARMGFVAQEVAPTDENLLDVVLSADAERAALMAEAETAEDPERIGEIYTRLADIDAYSAEARARSACEKPRPACCSPPPTCSSWTSRQIISTWKAPPGWKSTSGATRTPCWWSATTGKC